MDHRDERIEKILTDHAVDFEYRDAVPIAEIVRHPESQSRLRQVDKARVAQYAGVLRAGQDPFPPVVVNKDGYDGFRIIDGDGRISARRKRRMADVPAYIVQLSDDAECIYLSAIFNAKHGQPLIKAERDRAVRAALAIKENPPNEEQIARDYGVSRASIVRLREGDAAARRLSNLGVDPDPISQSHLKALNKLADDAVLVQSALLITDADLGVRETETMLAAIGSATSEADRLKVVAAEREDRAEAIKARSAGRVPAGLPVSDSRLILGRLLSLIDHYPNVDQWVPHSKEHLDAWTPKVHAAADFLAELAEAYDAAVGVADDDEDLEDGIADEDQDA